MIAVRVLSAHGATVVGKRSQITAQKDTVFGQWVLPEGRCGGNGCDDLANVKYGHYALGLSPSGAQLGTAGQSAEQLFEKLSSRSLRGGSHKQQASGTTEEAAVF
ncbi:hypothetical protein TREES_T100000093 [Tupaia chinensis]|uniref:Uncharacterized protein n=1 Tax=Tupaia chinensis TaxID=246437 RepID=L9L9I4_TUPCH|nr:hypothetical protein TREES_T100000093 [Tupaia chinensis]